MKNMGKGLGCISSKPHAHVVEFASTTSNSKAKLNINASPLHRSEEIRFAPVPSSSNAKLGINSSLEQATGKTQTNDGDFEALLARAQAAKINNNLIIGPQWTPDQQLLSQKKILKQDNPKVFFDIGIERNDNVERLVMELYEDTNPVTVHNFRVLCTGELGTNGDGLRLHYKSTGFHRTIREFMCQGGDLTRGQGNSPSIWGTKFPDENFVHKHTGPGVLSMANIGPNTNGSQFFLCTAATPWLNDMHVVFGQLLEGFEVLKAMEAVGSKSGTTSEDVKIVDCGQLS